MLVDPKFENRLHPLITAFLGIQPTRVEQGVYTNCGYNFGNTVSSVEWDQYDFDDIEGIDGVCGVGDSIEQVMGVIGEKLRNAPGQYAIGFTVVRKVDEPPEDGWRWHKWGEYMGVHKPQAEYLADEPEISEVVTFSIIKKR